MVGQSDLPFRLLCRRYGADVCYTEMIYSKKFSECQIYRNSALQTSEKDRPLIVQRKRIGPLFSPWCMQQQPILKFQFFVRFASVTDLRIPWTLHAGFKMLGVVSLLFMEGNEGVKRCAGVDQQTFKQSRQ
mmetsp:Transcript_23373/g.30526  ORF Transcript_23373/g.30526 Transcript_23373/m.30526 type:complete len:131 (-) Transcript_23373:447-839(-)